MMSRIRKALNDHSRIQEESVSELIDRLLDEQRTTINLRWLISVVIIIVIILTTAL